MDLIICVSKDHQEQEGEMYAPFKSTQKSSKEEKISYFDFDELLLGKFR